VIRFHENDVAGTCQLEADAEETSGSDEDLDVALGGFILAGESVNCLGSFFEVHAAGDEAHAVFLVGEIDLHELYHISLHHKYLKG